jgi:hypothetical protein
MSNKKEDYFIYSHHDPDITTMGQFITEPNSTGVGLNIPQLLNYRDENNQSNIDSLISLYDLDEHNAGGTGTFDSLIDQVKSYVPQQEENNTTITNNTDAEGIVKIETTKNIDNSTSTVTPKDISKLKSATQFTTNEQIEIDKYLADGNKLSLSSNIEFKLSELPSPDVRSIFRRFFKRIIVETGLIPTIISGFRTQLQEQELSSKSDFALNGGTSTHSLGIAIDINLEDPEWDSSSPPKQRYFKLGISPENIKAWINTRVPDIARQMNIRWGGASNTFTKAGPDTVHFDLINFYNVHTHKAPGSLVDTPQPETQVETIDPNTPYLDLPIKIGTVLALPLKSIERNILSTETNQTVNPTTFNSFLAKQLVDLLSSPGYIKTFHNKSGAFKGDVKEIYPYISVWIWSRALSISGTNEIEDLDRSAFYNHRIINVTPYISSLNTNVVENGGNFNMSLAPITADLRSQNDSENSFTGKGWKVKEGTQKSSQLNSGDYINQSHVHYIDDNELKRNRMYFEKVIQAQDIVFIRFERLLLEDKRQNLDELETISVNDLPNQIFDMIALVDNVQQTSDFSTLNVDVTVSGRDLVKLIIEDGVYLYPASFTEDGIFSNAGPTGSGATNTRLFRFDGNYLSKFTTLNRTIDRSLKWIINNLGTIEICPQDLFDGYQNAKIDIAAPLTKFNVTDKRSKAYQLTDDQKLSLSQQQHEDDNDKSKIIDKIIDIQKNNKIINGSAQDTFNKIKIFLQDRIKNKDEIKVVNGKIFSWSNIEEDKKVYKNKLPNNLDKSFYIADRAWYISKKDLANTNPVLHALSDPTLSTSISALEHIYKTIIDTPTSKIALSESNVDSVKELSRTQVSEFGTNSIFVNTIPFEQFISDISEYVKDPTGSDNIIFVQGEVDDLSATYKSDVLGKLVLGILIKHISDLNPNEKDVFNDIYNLIIKENSQKQNEPNQSLQPLAGIWQIIKLVIDDSVKDRRCYDLSLGNENGSILNAIRKVCQDPFCEFFTDTYGDQFYFIARKKPFDQKSILSMINGEVAFELPTPIDSSKVSSNENEFQGFTGVPDITPQRNLIIDIEEIDVLSDSLNYSTEAYSWYRLQLKNTLSDTDWQYLKAVYFNEFADIYGSKPMDLQTNYVPYLKVVDKNTELPAAYFIEQGIYDLKYMIECNACLPFTRMGVIIMNGDRRIKRGTFIRYKGTGEIFYVDAVSHSFSITEKNIDRTTTLQVSRGMVERFIAGVNISNQKPQSRFPVDGELSKKTTGTNIDLGLVSYFNICDLSIDESIFAPIAKKDSNGEVEDNTQTNFGKVPSAQWKVNRKVFNFFLKKLQFAKNDKEIFDALK